MKLKDAKTTIVPKAFVDLPALKLYISTTVNEQNQITAFFARYNGAEQTFNVAGMDIEKAWKQLETFIAKQSKR